MTTILGKKAHYYTSHCRKEVSKKKIDKLSSPLFLSHRESIFAPNFLPIFTLFFALGKKKEKEILR